MALRSGTGAGRGLFTARPSNCPPLPAWTLDGRWLGFALSLGLMLSACGSPMGDRLRSATAARAAPPGFSLVYDDHHPAWGGVRVTLSADRSMEVRKWQPGQAEGEERVAQGRVPAEVLAQILEVLLEIEAWEQRVEPERDRLDDARARLSFELGGDSASIWEYASDLESTRRIVRVKRHLDAIVFGVAVLGEESEPMSVPGLGDEDAGRDLPSDVPDLPSESTSDSPPDPE